MDVQARNRWLELSVPGLGNLVLGYLGSWILVGLTKVLVFVARYHAEPGFTWTGREGPYDDGVKFTLEFYLFLLALVLLVFGLMNTAIVVKAKWGGWRYWLVVTVALLVPTGVVLRWPGLALMPPWT